MKRIIVVAALLAVGCSAPGTVNRAPTTWYPAAEVVCHRDHCPQCRGSSHFGCPPCEARGWTPCTKCSDGTQVCDNCKGKKGYKENCRACKGDGRKDGKKCKECDGAGTRSCPQCDGKGRSACKTCGGDKKVDCGNCEAKGQLTCLRPVAIREAIPTGEDAWPPGNEPNQMKPEKEGK